MAYRWKPSNQQKREFAERMKDPEQKAAYEQSKKERADKKRSTSAFSYNSAGGEYIPTKSQHDYAVFDRSQNTTPEHDQACDMVAMGYSCSMKIHHDYIHIVNELIRKSSNQ